MITGNITDLPLSALSSSPSDYHAPDGDMAVLHNLTSDGSSLRPVPAPLGQFTLPQGSALRYVHHISFGAEVYITFSPASGGILYATRQRISDTATSQTLHTADGLTFADATVTFASVGNVLIVNVTAVPSGSTLPLGIHYFLAKADAASTCRYAYLGQRPPDLQLEFALYYPWADINQRLNTLDATLASRRSEVRWATVVSQTSLEQNVGAEGGNEADFLKWKSTADAVLAPFNAHIRWCREQSLFLQPFLVRYAYRLYDGSHIMQSAPVLMVPDAGNNPFTLVNTYSDTSSDHKLYSQILTVSRPMQLQMQVWASKAVRESLLQWKDIITSVDIFITPPIDSYSLDGAELNFKALPMTIIMGVQSVQHTTLARAWHQGDLKGYLFQGGTFAADHQWAVPATGPANVPTPYKKWTIDNTTTQPSTDDPYADTGNSLTQLDAIIDAAKDRNTRRIGAAFKRTGSVTDWVLAASTFFRLQEFTLDALCTPDAYATLTPVTRDGGILNLETFPQLTDGYHERTVKSASVLNVYNSRLNIADISEVELTDTHAGTLAPYTQLGATAALGGTDPVADGSFSSAVSTPSVADIYLEENGIRQIVTASIGDRGFITSWPMFLFYPNPTAKYINIRGTIRRTGVNRSVSLWFTLTPHPTLSGAVYFAGYYSFPESTPAIELQQQQPAEIATWHPGTIRHTNHLYTSLPGNPFSFSAAGQGEVGSGTIQALAATTQAVSSGTAFGQMPLYAFCTDGIWALQPDDQGQFVARQPVSRETLIHPTALLPIDNAILFLTARGLFQLAGGQTSLLSPQLSVPVTSTFTPAALPHLAELLPAVTTLGAIPPHAATFLSYIAHPDVALAFDYAAFRVHIFRPSATVSWLYDLSARTFSTITSTLLSYVHDYPVPLLNALSPDGSPIVVTFPDPSALTPAAPLAGAGQVFFLTRPFKLQAPDVYKTLRRLLLHLTAAAPVHSPVIILYASRDARRWHQLRILADTQFHRLAGTPCKFFALAFAATLTSPADTLERITLEYIPRYTNRPR